MASGRRIRVYCADVSGAFGAAGVQRPARIKSSACTISEKEAASIAACASAKKTFERGGPNT
eukprot:4685161-Alexandrium_andersonii.AAC.1